MNDCSSKVLFPLLAASICVAGCRQDADYLTVQAACEGELAAWSPSISASELVVGLGEGCAETMGSAVGLDWRSFGFTAASLDASVTGGFVVAGLFTILASEKGTAAEVLADDDLPEIAREALGGLGVSPDAPSAELWFTMAQDSIVSTIYIDSIPGYEGAGAAYAPETGEAFFGAAMLEGAPNLETADAPAWAAAIILHEAAHKFTPAHIYCEGANGNSCDYDREGSYGVSVWWVADWIGRYEDSVDSGTCSNLDAQKYGICRFHIDQDIDWAPCQDSCP